MQAHPLGIPPCYAQTYIHFWLSSRHSVESMNYSQTDTHTQTHSSWGRNALTLIVWHHIGILLVVHLLGVAQRQWDLVLYLQIAWTWELCIRVLEFLLLWMLVWAQLERSDRADADAHQCDQNAHEDANREYRSQLKAIRALSTALVWSQCNWEGRKEKRNTVSLLAIGWKLYNINILKTSVWQK